MVQEAAVALIVAQKISLNGACLQKSMTNVYSLLLSDSFYNCVYLYDKFVKKFEKHWPSTVMHLHKWNPFNKILKVTTNTCNQPMFSTWTMRSFLSKSNDAASLKYMYISIKFDLIVTLSLCSLGTVVDRQTTCFYAKLAMRRPRWKERRRRRQKHTNLNGVSKIMFSIISMNN